MSFKNSSESAPEALQSRFAQVFDIDTVLSYDFADFFDFCQYLGYFGYKAEGFAGRLQSPEEFVKRHLGNCWDQAELQRAWFERHGYKFRTYLLYYYLTEDNCPSHAILAYEDGDEWCWFEPTFYGTAVEYSGLHRYPNEDALLRDLRRAFALNGQRIGMLPAKLDESKWELYEYAQPEYGIMDEEFYSHCRNGRKIW